MYARVRTHTQAIALAILLAGCAFAEPARLDAETRQVEARSQADTIAALVAELRERDDLDQAVITALLAELEAGRVSRQHTETALLALLAEKEKPQTSPWAIIVLVILAAAGGALWFKRGPGRIVVVVLPQRDSRPALDSPWRMEAPQDVFEIEYKEIER